MHNFSFFSEQYTSAISTQTATRLFGRLNLQLYGDLIWISRSWVNGIWTFIIDITSTKESFKRAMALPCISSINHGLYRHWLVRDVRELRGFVLSAQAGLKGTNWRIRSHSPLGQTAASTLVTIISSEGSLLQDKSTLCTRSSECDNFNSVHGAARKILDLQLEVLYMNSKKKLTLKNIFIYLYYIRPLFLSYKRTFVFLFVRLDLSFSTIFLKYLSDWYETWSDS